MFYRITDSQNPSSLVSLHTPDLSRVSVAHYLVILCFEYVVKLSTIKLEYNILNSPHFCERHCCLPLQCIHGRATHNWGGKKRNVFLGPSFQNDALSINILYGIMIFEITEVLNLQNPGHFAFSLLSHIISLRTRSTVII